MREISLHLLDLVQNSIEAGASTVEITVDEDEAGYFVFIVADNGRGMNKELVNSVRDPFVTTRLTRKVGLGLALLSMSTARCGGVLDIQSQEGKGTKVKAAFLQDHLDRPPLGDLAATLKVLLTANPALRLIVNYKSGGGEFLLDSMQLKEILGESLAFGHPEVYSWLSDYLKQEIGKVGKSGR
ncbi:MAG: ATP-binding protein [Acholeplasmataceae bacterium]|nr:ATP-binding protein [Acholeplasmataceae bacterium]